VGAAKKVMVSGWCWVHTLIFLQAIGWSGAIWMPFWTLQVALSNCTREINEHRMINWYSERELGTMSKACRDCTGHIVIWALVAFCQCMSSYNRDLGMN
jgi:hypothetical protein